MMIPVYPAVVVVLVKYDKIDVVTWHSDVESL